MSEKVKKSTVTFDKTKGPIILEVSSGYATFGPYMLHYCKKKDLIFYTFGKEPKRLEDGDDFHSIPIDLSDLKDYFIIINGKYSPAPRHTQIKVEYKFIQENTELPIEPANSNMIEEETENYYERYANYFNFKEK